MEDKYRKHIKENTEELIKLTDYDKLMHACVYTNLLTSRMRQKIEDVGSDPNKNLTSEELKKKKHSQLFEKLTKRGPDAYQQLKMLLTDMKYDAAVRLLNKPRNDDTQFVSLNPNRKFYTYAPLQKPEVPNEEQADGHNISKSKQNADELPILSFYNGEIKPNVVHHVKKAKEICRDDKVGTYPMRSQHNRGIFFMVNIIDFPNKKENRNGAEADGHSLLHLFRELGFKLFAYNNLTQKEFFHLLDLAIDSEYTRDAECFVMALMTHGNIDGNAAERVQFHDGSIVKVADIQNRFDNRKCPYLIHKPKMFIFPFCRGDIADLGLQTDSIVMRPPDKIISSLSDMIVCYASLPGHKAHRDIVEGSWYVQKFCELCAKHAHDTSFEDIVKMIQNETGNLRTESGAMQMGSYVNTGFNKKLFFNPGIFETDAVKY